MTPTAYWNRFNARQRAIEKRFIGGKDKNGTYRDGVYPAIKAQYESVLKAITQHGYQYAKQNIHRIVTSERIVKVLKKLYRYAAHVEGNFVGSSLIKNTGRKRSRGAKGVDPLYGPASLKKLPGVATDASFSIGFDELADVVDEYFRIYQLNVSALPITDTTIRHIEERLFSQVQGGVPLDQAIREFREWAVTGGTARSISRAKGIIQTESTRAMSFGSLIGAYKAGVDVDKVWVTCADEKVRTRPYSHAALDGQMTGLFRAFNNGEPIKFPGDPEASKANVINCRCCQFFKEKVRARSRVLGRSLSNFLVDFFTGFFAGTQVAQSLVAGVGVGETTE